MLIDAVQKMDQMMTMRECQATFLMSVLIPISFVIWILMRRPQWQEKWNGQFIYILLYIFGVAWVPSLFFYGGLIVGVRCLLNMCH